jgi:hypothetical protein
MYILVWTDRIEGKFIDHWQAYEEQDQAMRDYERLLDMDDTWSASLCSGIIRSTDYEST